MIKKIKILWKTYKARKQALIDYCDEIDEWMYANISLWYMLWASMAVSIFILYLIDNKIETFTGDPAAPVMEAIYFLYENKWEIWEKFEIINECYWHPKITWDCFVLKYEMAWELDWNWDAI